MTRRQTLVSSCTFAVLALMFLVIVRALDHGAGPMSVRYTTSGSFALNGEYPTTDHRSFGGEHFGSWHGSDANVGTLTSTPFRAPLAITIRVAGGTAHDNQHLEIIGPDGKAAVSLRTANDAAETYVQITRVLPLNWWHHEVRFRAIDDGGGTRGWIGVADLRAASAGDVLRLPLDWLSEQGWVYYAVVYLCLLGLVASALFWVPSERARWQRGDSAFISVLIFTFLWLRWPVNVVNGPLNPDEAQTTAQAIKSLYDAIPWRGFDPTTSGPLNSYVLAIPHLIGIVPTLVSTHTVGALLQTLTALSLFAAGRVLWGSRIGSCAALAFVAIEALTREVDFIHTSSEVFPNALLAAALWSAACLSTRTTAASRVVSAAITGLLLGAMPVTKLQTIPSATVLAVAVLLVLCIQRHGKAAVTFCVGLAGVPALLVAATTIGGAFYDFYMSYLVANVSYAGGGYSGAAWQFFFGTSQRFGMFLSGVIACAMLLVVWLALCRSRLSYLTLAPPAVLVLLTLTAMYEAIAPHRYFPHYLALIVVPASLLVAALVALAVDADPSRIVRSRGRRMQIAGALAIVSVVLPQAFVSATAPDPFLQNVNVNATGVDPIATEILRFVRPGSRIVVWGWAPALYAYTGTVMGTRDCCSLLENMLSPLEPYYRDRYLNDFVTSKPALLVDAVAPGAFFLTSRAQQGVETFPELFGILKKDYALTGEIGGVRFFLRRRDTQP